jgi:hypothetical protein
VEVVSCSNIRKLFFTKAADIESIKEESKTIDETKTEDTLEETNRSKEDSFTNQDNKNIAPNIDTSKEYELLDKLFTLVNTKKEINPVLSGYFHKIVGSLLIEYKEELLKYLFSNKEHWDNLLYHCYDTSIADTVFDLLSITFNDSTEDLYHSHKLKVIADLIELDKVDIILKLISSKKYLDYLLRNEVIDYLISKDNARCLLRILKLELELEKAQGNMTFIIKRVLSIMESVINSLRSKDKV